MKNLDVGIEKNWMPANYIDTSVHVHVLGEK